MFSIDVKEADIARLLDDVNLRSRPIVITGDGGKNGVLISEEEWRGIQETLYLGSSRLTDAVELALDEADISAAENSDRMTHEEVFAGLRKRINDRHEL